MLLLRGCYLFLMHSITPDTMAGLCSKLNVNGHFISNISSVLVAGHSRNISRHKELNV